jgi:hypothetical protein
MALLRLGLRSKKEQEGSFRTNFSIAFLLFLTAIFKQFVRRVGAAAQNEGLKPNNYKYIGSNLIKNLVNHNLLTFDMKDSSSIYIPIP